MSTSGFLATAIAGSCSRTSDKEQHLVMNVWCVECIEQHLVMGVWCVECFLYIFLVYSTSANLVLTVACMAHSVGSYRVDNSKYTYVNICFAPDFNTNTLTLIRQVTLDVQLFHDTYIILTYILYNAPHLSYNMRVPTCTTTNMRACKDQIVI